MNKIKQEQWEKILIAFNNHCENYNVKKDEPYIGSEIKNKNHRQFIYDNYDRCYSPGLEFVKKENEESGKLYVYNSSEQAHAPISMSQGIDIAYNFFNDKGSQLSESIVCDHVMK